MMGLMFLKRKRVELTVSLHGGHSKMAAICKSGKEPSPDTELASTLILNCLISRTVRNKCLLFKHPSLWHFLTAAKAD